MMDRPAEHRQEGFGSFELDLETGAVTYSDGVRHILSAPAEVQLTSGLLLERVHREDRDVVQGALERSHRKHAPLRFEVRVRRFDAVERVVRARGDVVTSPEGKPVRVAGTLHDVTEEATSRADSELFSYVVQSTSDAIITKAPDGTITSWNRGAELLYGYPAEEAIGRPSGMTETPERAGEWQKLLQM